jgi:hypothetical protein
MAEIELSVLSSQCLNRRIPDRQTLIEEIAAWEADRNKYHAKAKQLLTFLFWRWLDGFVGRLTEGRDKLTQKP